MISPIIPSHDADTVALDFDVFIAKRALRYRCSREVIIAAVLETIPLTPPSQPGEASRSHAPAAQTDGAAEPPVPTEPSVDLSGLAAHEQGPIPSPAVPPAGEAADGQAETLLSEPSVAPPSKAKRKMAYARVKEAFEANPSGTATQIAAVARVHPSTAGTWLKQLRKDVAAKTTEALKAPPAKPQEAVEPPPAPEARPEPEQPPATIPVARALPLPPPVVKPMQKGPQGRFYLREKTEIGKPSRWVHQSLQPCPTGPGPLMTLDRKWAWYDTMERFKGAVKKWPELKDMRKEAAAK